MSVEEFAGNLSFFFSNDIRTTAQALYALFDNANSLPLVGVNTFLPEDGHGEVVRLS